MGFHSFTLYTGDCVDDGRVEVLVAYTLYCICSLGTFDYLPPGAK